MIQLNFRELGSSRSRSRSTSWASEKLWGEVRRPDSLVQISAESLRIRE